MLGIVDIIVLGVLLISVLFALYRGLVRELLGISSWILAAFVALYSYDPLQKFLDGRVENLKMASIIGAVIIALIVMVIVTIINANIQIFSSFFMLPHTTKLYQNVIIVLI